MEQQPEAQPPEGQQAEVDVEAEPNRRHPELGDDEGSPGQNSEDLPQ